MSDKKKDDEVKSCEINDMDFDDRDNHYFHFHESADDYSPLDDDFYTQPRALFNLMNDNQKAQLFSNIAASMDGVEKSIIDRALAHFEKISPDYANGVKKALGL